MTVGWLSEFNLWDYSMSQDALNSMACGAQGNVVSWTGTDSKWGTLREKQVHVPECSGKVYQIKCLASY